MGETPLPYEISPGEAKDWLGSGKAALLDVREPFEFAIARIEGSVLEPMNTVPVRLTAIGEAADADLRPLQIHQDADRPLQLRLDRAQDLVGLAVVLMRAVAEIEPEHIGAALEERANDRLRRAGRPERGDDLGLACAFHGPARVLLSPASS